MSDEVKKSQEATEPVTEQAPTAVAAEAGPHVTSHKKKRNQAYLVWGGIACLVLAAAAGWKVANSKEEFKSLVRYFSNPVQRDPKLMKDWADKLGATGGTYCKAIADMINTEQVPETLQKKSITNFDELMVAVGDGGELSPICQQEMTNQLNILSWVLAFGGIVLIGADILRERGKTSSKTTA